MEPTGVDYRAWDGLSQVTHSSFKAALVVVLMVVMNARWEPAMAAESDARWGRPNALGKTDLKEIGDWQEARDRRLRSDSGWLTIAGFHWLEPGLNSIGSSVSSDVMLTDPAIPDGAASIRVESSADTFRVFLRRNTDFPVRLGDRPVPVGQEREIRTDPSGSSDRVKLGRLTFWAMERGGKPCLRVRDPESPLLDEFAGLSFYPVEPDLRLAARYVRFPEARPLQVPSVLGYETEYPCYGTLHFEKDGKTYELWPLVSRPDETNLHFVFSDETTGLATYGGGRFIDVEVDASGRGVIDFNKAYNPPCAYNPFTTCPLPPAPNHLPFAVEAGEQVPPF